MYSRIRYPGLDSESSPEYVHHRRFVYGLLGLDVDSFFRGKTILDAGCGTGEETLFLASLGPAEIIGIDMSEGSLDHARSMAEKHGCEMWNFEPVPFWTGLCFRTPTSTSCRAWAASTILRIRVPPSQISVAWSSPVGI